MEQEKLGTEKQDRDVEYQWIEQETEKSQLGIQNGNDHQNSDHYPKELPPPWAPPSAIRNILCWHSLA